MNEARMIDSYQKMSNNDSRIDFRLFILIMEEIKKLKRLYDLKHVMRANHIRGRKESTAEHSRSALILADYFINIMKLDINIFNECYEMTETQY